MLVRAPRLAVGLGLGLGLSAAHAHALSSAKPPASIGTAVVTGGSRGIGAACSTALAARGYEVVVVYRSGMEEARQVVESIEKAGGRACAVQADVGDEANVVRLFKEVDQWRGVSPLKVLVNNAGVLGPKGDEGGLDALTSESLLNVLKINSVGPALCIREAEKRMSTTAAPAGTGGSIVQISSGSAYIGSPLQYAASKGALNSLTIGLVAPLARQSIRINTARRLASTPGPVCTRCCPAHLPCLSLTCSLTPVDGSNHCRFHPPLSPQISPGMTATDMIAETVKTFDMSVIPLGRVGTPQEIANTVVWLCSDEASYVAGANVRVAGGRPPGTTLG
jgi:NAD(P)-dependent dehydrogenase (short-subunit alcohol dehydrogenase family)